MMKKYKKNTRLEVFWRDIVSNAEWSHDTSAEQAETAVCRTLGYYTMTRKDALILSPTIIEEMGMRDTVVIPCGCIIKINKL